MLFRSDIVREAATCHGVTVADMLSTSRVAPLPKARAAAYWALRSRLKWSYGRIASVLGAQYGGVVAAIRRHEERMAQ